MLLNQAPQLDFPLSQGSQDESGLSTLPAGCTLCGRLGVDVLFSQLRLRINIKSGFTEAVNMQPALGSVLF